ncbi:MAG: DUF4249 domain-containing protein [Bacteroidales bacterium]|nr:DUF4249 domain-containing protein [Bacteroidales bacterium]
MIRTIILLAIICFAATSCEKEIEYNGKELNNFLVLNAELIEGETIRIDLTRSNTIFENKSIKTIGDAEVQLYIDGVFAETLDVYSYFEGAPNLNHEHYITEEYYYLYITKSVKAGSNYTIKVKHPDFEEINASTTVPPKADARIKSIEKVNGMHNYTLVINDPPGKNYYRLRAEACYEYPNYEGETERSCYNLFYYDLNTKDPILSFNKIIDEDSFTDYPDNVYLLFDDELFDGESYELKISIWAENPEDVSIEILQLDENLYQYYNTVQMRDYYEDYAFGEPVRVYSNVNSGAGILGSSTSKLLKLED